MQGLSVFADLTECGRSGSVPWGSDGHQSSLSEFQTLQNLTQSSPIAQFCLLKLCCFAPVALEEQININTFLHI